MKKGYTLIELLLAVTILFTMIFSFCNFMVPVLKNVYGCGKYSQNNIQLNNILSSVRTSIYRSSSIMPEDSTLSVCVDGKIYRYYVESGFFIKKLKNKTKLNSHDFYFESFSCVQNKNLLRLSYVIKLSGKKVAINDAVRL